MGAGTRVQIAFIGFGEVGQRFAADLIARPGVRVAAYDIGFADPARKRALLGRAEALGVDAAASAARAIEGAGIVISAVTADAALDVARDAAAHLDAGQLFLDVNSASPGTKAGAAEAVNAPGARYVEGAVMGAVAGPGLGVEILAGGPAAADAAALLNPLGARIVAVSESYGRASALKLCRSIMIKGIEALIADCAAATRHWGVEDEVYASLAKTFPGTDWREAARYMGERVATHGVRRSAEMREAAAMLAELGRDPALAEAVAAAQSGGARKR